MSGPALLDLFVEHVGPSTARHMALLRAVEGLPCHLDLKNGDVRFGSRHTFAGQLLGVETQDAWTWSWAMPPSVVAPSMTESARTLKSWGEEHGHEPFFVPTFATDALNGDHLVILSCGITGSDSFVAADTELGTAYVLLPDVRGELPQRHPAELLAEVVPAVLSTYTLPDHARVVRSLLRFEEYEIDETERSTWHARRRDGSRITVTFDRLGRVSALRGHDER